MRSSVLILLLAAAPLACRGPREIPEGSVQVRNHPEFEEFRPVAIAVLPVKAPTRALRLGLRGEVYDGLPRLKYSPLKLEAVDARITTRGEFDPGSFPYDATVEIEVTRWKAVGGRNYYVMDAVARMRHKTGEVLWTAAFSDYAVKVSYRAGELDDDVVAEDVAALILKQMPVCPPLPERE